MSDVEKKSLAKEMSKLLRHDGRLRDLERNAMLVPADRLCMHSGCRHSGITLSLEGVMARTLCYVHQRRYEIEIAEFPETYERNLAKAISERAVMQGSADDIEDATERLYRARKAMRAKISDWLGEDDTLDTP